MSMGKFNGNKNITGNLIKAARIKHSMSRVQLSKELEKLNIFLTPYTLYRIENNLQIVKDFEILAIMYILEINVNLLKDLL